MTVTVSMRGAAAGASPRGATDAASGRVRRRRAADLAGAVAARLGPLPTERNASRWRSVTRRAWRQVGRQKILGRVRADVADPGRASCSSRRQVEALAAPGSSACSPARPASTGRCMPSVRTTRWQGTISGTGLCPSAVPTARTAFGRPISAAIQPYGRTSPRGISSALRQTSRSKSVWPRRSRSIRTPAVAASRRAMAAARRSGSVRGAMARRPGPGPVRRLERGVVGGRLDAPTRRARSRRRRAARSASRTGRTGRPGRPRRGRRGEGRRRRASASAADAPPRAGRVGRWSCGHLLAFAPLGGLERRSQQGQAAVDLGLDGALGSVEGGGELGIGQAVDVAEHDGAAIGRRQGQQQAGPVARRRRSATAAAGRRLVGARLERRPAAARRATAARPARAASAPAASGTG